MWRKGRRGCAREGAGGAGGGAWVLWGRARALRAAALRGWLMGGWLVGGRGGGRLQATGVMPRLTRRQGAKGVAGTQRHRARGGGALLPGAARPPSHGLHGGRTRPRTTADLRPPCAPRGEVPAGGGGWVRVAGGCGGRRAGAGSMWGAGVVTVCARRGVREARGGWRAAAPRRRLLAAAQQRQTRRER